MNYDQKLASLRARKLRQTREKIEREGVLDEDDYGRIVPPEGLWKIRPNHPDGSFYGFDAWTDNFCSLMAVHPVYVDPDDAFAGRWMYFMSKMRPNKWNPAYPYDHLKADIARYDIICGIGDDAHFAPDYRMGLELGWGGLLEKIAACRKLNPSPGQQHFYDLHERAVRSVQGWIGRHIAEAERLAAEEPDAGRRDNLLAMAQVNRNILNRPPETLREACQWIVWYHLASRTYNRDGAGAQIDALLRPYYERDKALGLTDDEAVYYLACLLINDPVYWQLGGPDETGRDQTSRISFLVLEAAGKIDTSLNITVRVHDGLDPELFRAAVACLIYAIVVLIRILCGKYDEQKLPDITFELVDMTPETPADPETTPEETPEAAAEPETAPEETPEAKPEAETPAEPETPETPAEPEKSDETEDTPDA